MQRFEQQIAVISGAASGIGAATAKRFAEEGIAALILLDVQQQALEDVAQSLRKHCEVVTHCIDISEEARIEQVVQQTKDKFGRIDVLCNNAGVVCTRATATGQNLDDWQRVIQVNVYGTVLLTKYVAQVMQQQGRGAIVNTASVAGIRSGAGGNAYSASKAAVINFTQTSACDLGEFNIRVNAVCPGLIETGMTKPFFDRARERGIEDRLGERCELRRAGQPHEVAATIAFLASSDASFITGQALAVDGGNTASLNMPGMKA